MRLKAKIFLLAIVPFLLAIAGIGFGVRQQATSLARTQHVTIQAAYLSSKEVELKQGSTVDVTFERTIPIE